MDLGRHDIAPVVHISDDGKECLFIRPHEQQRYQRPVFSFAGFRYVSFSDGEQLVSFCKGPEGKCSSSQRGLEDVFSGKDYLHSTAADVLGGWQPLCPCAQELLQALPGGEAGLRQILSTSRARAAGPATAAAGSSDNRLVTHLRTVNHPY